MVNIRLKESSHPEEELLSAFMDGSISEIERLKIERHISACDECLSIIVSAHESVGIFKKKNGVKKEVHKIMKKINIYFVLAAVCFMMSFAVPRYFLQFLVATMVLGAKWVIDSKSVKMLIMIHEAWKRGGEKEASEAMRSIEPKIKNRL